MSIAAGTRLGPYEIVSPIGAGGMGEVYKARDSRLDRAVAIKILPPALAADPLLRERFEREAKAVAAISHPNILAIHDVGHSDHVTFAVMELLEGETLRERLAAALPRGLQQRKAIDYALQVAHGLAAAHEKGIVHRDLKPENIFITADGRAKILDFGLAKQQVDAGPLATMTPTIGGTTPGTVLGTVGYMAPEQLRGLSVDQRADVFALGAVLYEMLAGRRAFQGATTADTISAILHAEPTDLTQVDASLPSSLDRIIRRCLEKNAAERFHSAHDVALALEAVSGPSGSSAALAQSGVAPVFRRKSATRALGAASLVLLGAALGAGALQMIRRDRAAPSVHLAVLPPDKVNVVDTLALSADGHAVAFVGVDAESIARVWVRRLDEAEPRMVAGTEGATFPFWSPDGKSIGFFANGRLQRIDLGGGPARPLASISSARGGAWNADGVIVFAPNSGDGLYRVAAEGGPVTRLTTLDPARREVSHRWPSFLPDGNHVLFLNRSPDPDERLASYVTALNGADAGRPRKLTACDSQGAYSNGQLFCLRGTTMFAQPFDVGRLQFTSEKRAVFENIWADPNTDGLVAFAVSGNTFAFRTGKPSRQLGWFDRTGKSLGLFEPRQAADPELSQDDRLLAFEISETSAGGPKTGLWTSELARGNATRLGPATRNDVMPTWSPDGKRIIFASDRAGSFDLYEKPVGQAPERELLRSSLWKYPESWSPDGRYLLFSQLDPKTRSDIWLLPLDGGKPAVFVGTDADEMLARFSPDGRWVAYTSDESGRPEVYVRAFPLTDARWQVSVNGGTNPLWRRDGRELFYISLDNRVVSAAVNAGGTTFDAGVPSTLFNAGPLARGAAVLAGDRLYAVTSRGDRFLVVQLASDVRASAITVVVGGR